MAQGQQLILFSIIAIIFLMILTKCNAYPWLQELSVPQRPAKLHSANEADRYDNRLKQYYQTMAHLRYWRRDINEGNNVYDDTLEELLGEYDDLQYKR